MHPCERNSQIYTHELFSTGWNCCLELKTLVLPLSRPFLILTITSDILKHWTPRLQLHFMNTCKLTSRLLSISRHFWHCCQSRGPKIGASAFIWQLSAKKSKQRKREKVDFFRLWWKTQRADKFEKFPFPAFLWLVRYKYYTQESLFTLYRRQILEISGFLWEKGALFSGFHNGEWKLKEVSFFSFGYKTQIKTLIFWHFSFS